MTEKDPRAPLHGEDEEGECDKHYSLEEAFALVRGKGKERGVIGNRVFFGARDLHNGTQYQFGDLSTNQLRIPYQASELPLFKRSHSSL